MRIVLLLILLCSGSASLANSIPTVGVTPIANLMMWPHEKPAAYNIILERFSGISPYFAPAARVDNMFMEKKLDCLFPASTATMDELELVIQSIPVHLTHTFIFSRTPYQSQTEFQDKAVGVRHGLSLGAVRDKLSANFVELPSVEAMINMLKAGRIDAFVSYEIDALASYRKMELATDFYLKTAPMHTAEEAFVCHDTPENQLFIQRVNEDIKGLKVSGELPKILAGIQ